jgi:hypothetical protein
MSNGSITNALIRCTRQDREAEGLFELTRPDLGLWVLELDYTRDGVQAEQIAQICRQVKANSARLQKLDEGSADYTLHLTFDLPERERIVLPPALSRLASECGFNLELYATRDEEG